VAPSEAFFLPRGDGRWLATEHTVGPWSRSAQHAGPPAALLGRAIEGCSPRPEMLVSRVTCEILGAVPVGEVEVRAEVARPGRSVEMLEATLSADGRDAIRCRAWRVLGTDAPATSVAEQAPPRPEAESRLPERWRAVGYLAAVEWRFVRGGFGEPGPAAAWTRLRVPLVPGEEPSPLTRVLAVADSGNGISGELDLDEWMFINTELTVHIHRPAEGEWICLDAATTISAGGAGLAGSTLHDDRGPVARGAQSLFVTRRGSGPG
jgi:Acyl-CoA thioesterase C-terminal domain/Acyl-CoA thioesterase N-terminal domain